MTVILLGAILEGAVERELIAHNPARGKGKRVRERAPRRTYLDRRHIERKAMMATLVFAGLRIGELCALRWRDVDLEAGWL
ncbi:MAG TPA: tyrosine-type recombinase/integrase [Solirubrobacteraceae bacterium]|jgi:integrase